MTVPQQKPSAKADRMEDRWFTSPSTERALELLQEAADRTEATKSHLDRAKDKVAGVRASKPA